MRNIIAFKGEIRDQWTEKKNYFNEKLWMKNAVIIQIKIYDNFYCWKSREKCVIEEETRSIKVANDSQEVLECFSRDFCHFLSAIFFSIYYATGMVSRLMHFLFYYFFITMFHCDKRINRSNSTRDLINVDENSTFSVKFTCIQTRFGGQASKQAREHRTI
jgi:hypothetical protein